ncbi:hypothetical protein ACE01N_19880 [Saccharicrinis sp. FJH2]|uniref:hypothetical protein n=1 Tax=Saccharicrinis sp. FJH65 TaxID=3344659 RepID=UPI0035F405EC
MNLRVLSLTLILIFTYGNDYSAAERIKPSHKSYGKKLTKRKAKKLNSIFLKWSQQSIPRSDIELENMDSITKCAYDIYEKLFSDTTILDIKPTQFQDKYLFIKPIEIIVAEPTDSLPKDTTDNFYPKIIAQERFTIQKFKPKVELKNRDLIYLNPEIEQEIKVLYKKYNKRDLIKLVDNRSFEYIYRCGEIYSHSNIEKIVIIPNTNSFIITYTIKKYISSFSMYVTLQDVWIRKNADSYIKIANGTKMDKLIVWIY